MSASLSNVEDNLTRLESLCKAGELDDAETLMVNVDIGVKQFFSDCNGEVSESQLSLLNQFNERLSQLNQYLTKQKVKVSQQLITQQGNKKKINAYKSV
ncbi:hypothetical protein [Pseudoalteromonas luteoviolacea]|uniref:Flagellar protein FliT n=1 Tax=Pseudoalteromonas luteoviolacea H33 TaxID=1365251 RepID=A0A167C3Q4_9GAMM|nr:hypothetical protein [Pseudoalteromonas luteoviolacea]KZN47201.1 hypothetical protein N476_23770 [Pseudoalteromonas luteoviolacea H33]KZN77183.1 hypothetical protein N477_12420 [Pseudoalteromonas luteoviolacea H33-S]MBQ4879336.1 hypothetical protein [Pseudoalteromonas luteoviolacea]MBQ4908396.1 hypothetical protein [Pseudoalteromonas luteoviolacea]